MYLLPSLLSSRPPPPRTLGKKSSKQLPKTSGGLTEGIVSRVLTQISYSNKIMFILLSRYSWVIGGRKLDVARIF
jgi:hypothetical protein